MVATDKTRPFRPLRKRSIRNQRRAAIASAIKRERCGLAKAAKARNLPRTKPTLARVAWLEREGD